MRATHDPGTLVIEILVQPASTLIATDHRSEPFTTGEAMDDLSRAVWEDAEWR